jgi:hypothetical protein
VLYGSRARGDVDPDSDVDVAIVVRDPGAQTRDRILDVVTAIEFDRNVPLSILILSQAEYGRLLRGERRHRPMTEINRAAAIAEDSHLFSRLMKYREEADYNPSYLFTKEDARKLRDETAALASRIAEIIRQSGYEA